MDQNILESNFEQFYNNFTKDIHISNYAKLQFQFINSLDFPDSLDSNHIEIAYKNWIRLWFLSNHSSI